MQRRGFTIVELLIVIVIIGILASVVIMAYTGIQSRARDARMETDTKALVKAIIAARVQTGQTLLELTGTAWTADACYSQASGTDLAALPDTDPCWVAYNHALDVISNASGANLEDLKDPWGRPYYIDENEGEDPFAPCQEDIIAGYSFPFEYYGANIQFRTVPLSLPDSSC